MKTYLELSADAGAVDWQRAKEVFKDSRPLFYKKVDGIKEQIRKGRYNRYSIMEDGKIRVNYFVYYDYSTYRELLEDEATAKYVPDFEPKLIAEITPVAVVHHIE